MRVPKMNTWTRTGWAFAALLSAILYAGAAAGFVAEKTPHLLLPAAGVGALVSIVWLLLVRSVFGRTRHRRDVP